MEVLNEIRFNDNRILLNQNLVRSAILPKLTSELDRDVVVQGATIIEGAVYARNFELQNGPLTVKGCVYTQVELHVNTDASGPAFFEKAVSSASAIVSLAPKCRVHFQADINAKQVKLRNCYVAANIFADEVVLDNCVVVGGVFATRSVELSDCIVGTFNSPVVRLSKTVYLLFPSAFSVERVSFLPKTELYSLTLADLGALMRGVTAAEGTGKIRINIEQDEVRAVLSAEGTQQVLRSYSVVGKVLGAGLIDYEKLQNKFLIACASMGNQLLHAYDLGLDSKGQTVELTPAKIAEFFFSILDGKTTVHEISGEVNLADLVKGLAGDADELVPVQTSSPATTETIGESTQSSVPSAQGADLEQQDGATTVSEEDASAQIPAVSDGAERRCSACGAEVDPESTFCGECGQRLI